MRWCEDKQQIDESPSLVSEGSLGSGRMVRFLRILRCAGCGLVPVEAGWKSFTTHTVKLGVASAYTETVTLG